MKYLLNSDYWFYAAAIVWLYLRQWPTGDTLQTYGDIVFILVFALIGFRHYRHRRS